MESISEQESDKTLVKVSTLNSEIIKFVDSLPYWSRFLSEKLLSGNKLSDAEIEKSYCYLLEEAGLLTPSTKPQISITCKANSGNYKEELKLLNLENVEGVNALVENQTIEFSPSLTIIYGANGSGKSGYIRLLNNVFITKGDKTILSNIYSTTNKNKSAIFNFESTTVPYSLKYPEDCSKPEFSQFSVFDNKSVSIHLNNKNQFEFRPAGLLFFSKLNEAYKKIEEKIHFDIQTHGNTKDYAVFFEDESEIKILIRSISYKTKIEELKKHLPFSETDRTQRIEFEEQKLQLLSLKKDKEISDLEEKKNLIMRVRQSIESLNKYFTSDQLNKAQLAIVDCVEKEEQAKKDGIENFKTDKIKNIGTSEWKEFIKAADIFARQQNGGEKIYPKGKDSCLLCLQPLSDDAVKLINSYWTFIKSKAEQDAKNALSAINNAKTLFERVNFELLPEENILAKWLSDNYKSELSQLKIEIQTQKALCINVIEDIDKKASILRDEIQINISPLNKIIETIDSKINSLQLMESNKAFEDLNKKIVYLNHKEKLTDHILSIEKYINDLKWASVATKAKSSISKRKITDQEKELSSKYFNQSYINIFNEECRKLKGNFGIDITYTGSSGTSFRQLLLKGKQPTDILSEGEQKVISLADFIAETKISEINKGIIFDDPVTSLDDDRKSNIADRLVEESTIKQVIIFTHDLVFVSSLISRCEDVKIDFQCHWIEKRANQPGYIFLRNAPSYEKNYRNVEIPRNMYLEAKAENCPPNERESLIRNAFTSLRTCYEVLVINDLFKNVVQRFNERVSIESLKNVSFDIETRDEILENFGLCCRYMEGHIHSDKYAYKKPELENLKDEIERFETLRIKIKKGIKK